MRREQAADIDRRRAVDCADDPDRRCLVSRESKDQREEQHAEDSELAGSSEQHHPGVLEQRPEIGKGADADEYQQRKELVADADLV